MLRYRPQWRRRAHNILAHAHRGRKLADCNGDYLEIVIERQTQILRILELFHQRDRQLGKALGLFTKSLHSMTLTLADNTTESRRLMNWNTHLGMAITEIVYGRGATGPGGTVPQ